MSVYSDITGKGSVEITQLPNAKFAIYLSKNMYDMISDMIYLLYKLDEIISTSATNSNLTLSPEMIMKIQNIIKSFATKLTTVKTSLKDALALLNTITMEQINMLLFDHNKPVSSPLNRQCKLCLFVSKSDRGKKDHLRKCKKATINCCDEKYLTN